MEDKSRSPRYPSINLAEAVDRIKTIYEKEHTHRANREVIARDLGYAGLNGASAAVIGSLRQFGLLESAGDGLRVSDIATTIVELPPGSPERVEALREAALSPKLFAELNEFFGPKLPSDENLRLFLVKKGFNSKAAGIAIRTYRDTVSLVKDEERDYNDSSLAIPRGQETTSQMQFAPGLEVQRAFTPKTAADLQALNVPLPGSYTEDLQYRISEDCKVRVLFDGAVTREAIQKLIAYLQLGMDDFPSKTQHERRRQVTAEEPQPKPRLLGSGDDLFPEDDG